MATLEVPPLDPEDGCCPASLLLKKEGVETLTDAGKISKAVSEAAGHIPNYIHWLVSRVRNTTNQSTTSVVKNFTRAGPGE